MNYHLLISAEHIAIAGAGKQVGSLMAYLIALWYVQRCIRHAMLINGISLKGTLFSFLFLFSVHCLEAVYFIAVKFSGLLKCHVTLCCRSVTYTSLNIG